MVGLTGIYYQLDLNLLNLLFLKKTFKLVGNNLNVRKVESLKINYLITASIEVQEQVLHLVELLPRSAQVTLILLFLVLPQLLLCMQPALKILYYLAKNTFIIEA